MIKTSKILKTILILTILKSTFQFTPKLIEIKDSKKENYGYPSKVFIKADKELDLAKQNSSSVVYYGYKTQDPNIMDAPSERILIIKIESNPKKFIGIQFYIIE